MAKRQLLCVCLGGVATRFNATDAWEDWEICVVTSLKEAARVLNLRTFLVGLLIGTGKKGECETLDLFLGGQWLTQWVGVLPAEALRAVHFRNLVTDHFHDFHTFPIDEVRLLHTLGHAYGYACLREPQASTRSTKAITDMDMTGDGAAMARLRRHVLKVAAAAAPVLISGESGSGKELAARAIHAHSIRAGGPFVGINCGAIPGGLIQSELFGHEKGAFTGAVRDKPGLIESAAGGSVFLDEIADLPLELQTNLLRFLQEKIIHRVGATRSITADVRVIAATHFNLEKAVERGSFRADLYYRLNVLALEVPPLRERKEDLIQLAEHFFTVFFKDRAPGVRGFSSKALEALSAHDWPGNVRELSNRIRRAMVMAEGRLIEPYDLGLETLARRVIGDANLLGRARVRVEREAIVAAMHRAGPNISQAARYLGVSRMTLYRLIAKHQIRP